jgi:hypothetical protein
MITNMLRNNVESVASNLALAKNKIWEILHTVLLVVAEGIEFLQRNRVFVEMRMDFLKEFHLRFKTVE